MSTVFEYAPTVERYQPTDWQKEDLDFLKQYAATANWSEMGCYKTTTALWLMDDNVKTIAQDSAIPPVALIITTKSGKGAYFDAIPKSLEDWDVINVDAKRVEEIIFGELRVPIDLDAFVQRVQAGTVSRPTVIIAHYNCFTKNAKWREMLQSMIYTMIILDEAHRIKSRDAQWTTEIKKLQTFTGCKHIMTGTGFINRPDEIFSLLQFIAPNRFRSYWKFRRYFCEEENWNGYSNIVGVKEDKIEEFRRMRKSYGPRRELSKVREDIPLPTFVPMDVDLNATQRKMYDEIKTNLRTLDQQGVPIYSANVLTQLQRLRQVCVATPQLVKEYYDEVKERRVQEIKLVEPSSKLDALMELLEGLEWDGEGHQQIVLFSCFTDPLELAEARFKEANIPYLWMQAKHGEQARYNMWHDMWPQREHQVFMSTIQLGSESINLTSAQRVVFLDRDWSPKNNLQAIGRVYRPGQTLSPIVVHINARKTTDQRIEKRNEQKIGWFKTIFGEDDV